MKEETRLRDKHFIIIYIHIIIVIISSSNSNDDTDDGEWVYLETLVDISFFGSVQEDEILTFV